MRNVALYAMHVADERSTGTWFSAIEAVSNSKLVAFPSLIFCCYHAVIALLLR
jgi:hypothetical protein